MPNAEQVTSSARLGARAAHSGNQKRGSPRSPRSRRPYCKYSISSSSSTSLFPTLRDGQDEKAAAAQTHRSSIPNRLHAPPPQQLQHPEKPVNSSTSQQAACEGSFSVPTTNRQQYPRWHILRRDEDTSEHRSRRAQRTASKHLMSHARPLGNDDFRNPRRVRLCFNIGRISKVFLKTSVKTRGCNQYAAPSENNATNTQTRPNRWVHVRFEPRPPAKTFATMFLIISVHTFS